MHLGNIWNYVEWCIGNFFYVTGSRFKMQKSTFLKKKVSIVQFLFYQIEEQVNSNWFSRLKKHRTFLLFAAFLGILFFFSIIAFSEIFENHP